MKPKKELIRIVKAPDIKDENGEVLQRGEVYRQKAGQRCICVPQLGVPANGTKGTPSGKGLCLQNSRRGLQSVGRRYEEP